MDRHKRTKKKPIIADDITELNRRERIAHRIAMGFLTIFGLIYSLSFLGHFIVPNSDFPAFLGTGFEWLHFRIPDSMKRAPFFSIITALAGKLFFGPDRYLFGTELYNALMLPLAMVLIYIVSRRIIGSGAVWIAMLAGISPPMVQMSSEPLAELTLVVLYAAAVICIRPHIKTAYLFAMLASISRWDMAGLIPAVMIADWFQNRRWGKTIIFGLLASIPFILCMIITKLQFQNQAGGANYLQVLAQDRTFELLTDLQLYWQNIMSFLNAPLIRQLPTGRVESFEAMNSTVFWITAPLLLTAFLIGAVLSIIRRQLEIITMLLPAIPYVLVHAIYPYRMSRFCVPVQWGGLLVAVYGIIFIWQKFLGGDRKKRLVAVLSLTGTVIFVLWTIKIIDTFGYAQKRCAVIEQTTFIASLTALAGFFILQIVRKTTPSAKWLVVPAFLLLAVVSSGVVIGFVMGDGQTDANFKKLAEWFLENAKDDDRLITTMPGFMPIYTGLPQERFVHMGNIKPQDASDFSSFIQECRKQGVTLVAWDSRLAASVNDRYYKLWGLDRIKILSSPFLDRKVENIGPCRLVHLISEGSPKIAVYRIIQAD